MPPDEIDLLRLMWHPDDFEGEAVKPTAFPRSELIGQHGKYVSTDRRDWSRRAVMEATAKRQQMQADGVDRLRHSPYVVPLPCGDVRRLTVDDQFALGVKPYPLAENEAHCGIESIIGKIGRGVVDELRNKLSRLALPRMTLDQAYSSE